MVSTLPNEVMSVNDPTGCWGGGWGLHYHWEHCPALLYLHNQAA